MKKVFIIDSNGFIGRNLAESYAGNYDLYCPKRAELDLTDGQAVESYLEKFF